MRLFRIACIFVMAAAGVALAQSQFGRYEAPAAVLLFPDSRKIKLLKDFVYIDPKGTRWLAPAGSIVDGATIPMLAWSLVGGPLDGNYWDASIIHDVACVEKTRPWESAHETFYWGLHASDVNVVKAKIMYAAVYHFGPRWPSTEVIKATVTQGIPRVLAQVRDSADRASKVEILSTTESPPEGPGQSNALTVAVLVTPPPQLNEPTAAKARL